MTTVLIVLAAYAAAVFLILRLVGVNRRSDDRERLYRAARRGLECGGDPRRPRISRAEEGTGRRAD